MMLRKTRTKLIGLGLAISSALSASMIAPARADNKAQEVIKQARAVIGGDSKIVSITSLEMSRKLTTRLGDKNVNNHLTPTLLQHYNFNPAQASSPRAAAIPNTP